MKKMMLPVALSFGLLLVMSVLMQSMAIHAEALLQPQGPAGNVLTVCLSGACDYTSVQAAVDAASEGDLVKVATGVYTDVHMRPCNVASGVVTQVVYISKTLTIQGGYTVTNWTTPNPEAYPTTLDAQGQGRVFFIADHVTVTIKGLRITGGDAEGLGGLGPDDTDYGGGILGYDSTITLEDNEIFNNSAVAGGGIFVGVYSPGVFLHNNEIYNNTAVEEGVGGGGVFIGVIDFTLSENYIHHNTGNQKGGGFLAAVLKSTVDNNVIVHNHLAEGGTGSGLHLAGGRFDLRHNTVSANTGGTGVGLHVQTDYLGHRTTVFMTNTLLVDQEVGLNVTAGNTATVAGVLWWDNVQNTDGGGLIDVTHAYTGAPAFAPDGYHLTGGSAAINRGLMTELGTDIDGDRRPIGPLPDLGADETPYAVTMVVVPSGDATATARAAEELARLLEEETGYDVHTFVAGCYGAAVEALAAGEADIGWLPAATYVLAYDRFGVEAKLVVERFGSTSYRGQFIARADSGIDNLADLAGKNFAFVDPLSSSGFIYPALQISNTQGMTYGAFFNQTIFAGAHDAVVEAVYNAQSNSTPIHGGATYEDARWSVIGDYPDVITKTKVLTYTERIPNDTVSIRPGLDAIVAQQVISGLLTLAETPEGTTALQDLYNIQGLQPTDDSAYDIVRQAVAAFDLEYETCSATTDVTKDGGGSLTYVDGEGMTTTLQIPAGAVSETVQLNYAPLPAVTYPPAGFTEIGRAFNVWAVISGTNQPVTTLSAPYTLSLIYRPEDLGSVTEDGLALYGWDGTAWQKEPTSEVCPSEDVVFATPDHFSHFAVLGMPQIYLPLVLRE